MNDLLMAILAKRTGPGCSCDMCLAIPSVRPCEARDLIMHVAALEGAVQQLLDAKSEAETLGYLQVLRILVNS